MRLAGGSRPAPQDKIPLSAAGANKDVMLDYTRSVLANITYLARTSCAGRQD